MKSARTTKEVSRSVLEARLKRAVRPKDRLQAILRLASELTGNDATQTERALALFIEAEQLATTTQDRRGIAAALRGAGGCHIYFSNLAMALETLQRALPIAEQTGDAECEIMVLRDLGNVYSRQSRNHLAIETLQKCAELAELMGNIRVQTSALYLIGVTLTNLGRYEESIEYHTKSLTLLGASESVPLRHRDVPRMSSLSMGNDHSSKEGGRAQHVPTSKGSHSPSKGGLWTHDRAIILLSLSNALRHLGRYAEALSALEKSRELSHSGQNSIVGDARRMEALCQGSIGILYLEIGDYPKALSYLFASATILEHVGDKQKLATAYVNLTAVYQRLGDIEQIKDFGEKALKVFEELDDKRGQAVTFLNLGEYYLDRGGQTPRALRLLNRSLDLSKEIGSKNDEMGALAVLARLNIQYGKFGAADERYRKVLTIAQEIGDRDHTVDALLGLGKLFNKLGKPDEALSFLNQAIEVAGEIHSRHYEQDAHQILAETFETIGDLKHALEHLKLAASIKEEILGIEKQKAIIQLQIRADIEKSKGETALLKKETKSKSQEIERIAMELAEKTELIRSVNRRIRDIIRPWNGTRYSEFDTLLSELAAQDKRTIFNNEFQLVHRDIIHKLSTRYPNLTSAERKICMLLRDELSVKEMAMMLKVTSHAIKKHRRAIRRKMKLGPEMKLTTVLAGM